MPIASGSEIIPPARADEVIERGAESMETPPDKRDHKTAAQRSQRRRGEIPDRWVPAGREVLEVFQDAGR